MSTLWSNNHAEPLRPATWCVLAVLWFGEAQDGNNIGNWRTAMRAKLYRKKWIAEFLAALAEYKRQLNEHGLFDVMGKAEFEAKYAEVEG